MTSADAPVLHLRGPVLVGPEEVRGQAWAVGGRVTFDRPRHAGETVTLDGWVVPGLVDAHSHVGLDADGPVDEATQERQARADRDAGALLLRDAGSPADTRWTDARDDLPPIVRAGRHIARTRRYLRGIGRETEPEDLVAAVREEAARGDGWVKLVGDWIDRDLGDLAPCWPADAVAAGIAAAHEAGARVTAHCFGEQALEELLAAGIDGVEHATGMTAATARDAAARGVAVVPTLVNTVHFPDHAAAGESRFPAYAAHMRDLHRRRYETVRLAHQAGVALRVGTDAGGSLPHGLVAREIAELVVAGLTGREALDAGCWAARRWLGRPGLEEGAPADLVVLDADPRGDVAVLTAPRHVVLRGRRVA